MMSTYNKKELYERHSYLNKSITNLKSCIIIEYDMKDAGFSIIRYNKLLDKKTLNWLSNLNKKTRNIQVGLILRNRPDISKILMEEFIRIRKKFFELNYIEEDQILSIKKDAIFTINKKCKELIIDDYFEFKPKNTYSSYFYINNIEFYYSSSTGKLSTKGLGKNCKNGFLDDIKNIMKLNETLSYEKMFKYLKRYRSNYLNLKLPIESYRQLNSNNKYLLNIKLLGSTEFITLDNIDEKDLLMRNYIDITYNYVKYIIPIISLLV